MLSNSNKNTATFLIVAACIPIMVFGFLMLSSPYALAAGVSGSEAVAKKAIGIVVTVIKLIGGIVGVILIIQGAMKYAMAHANDNGPEQTKAITTLAAGAALIIFALIVLDLLDIPGLITGITDAVK